MDVINRRNRSGFLPPCIEANPIRTDGAPILADGDSVFDHRRHLEAILRDGLEQGRAGSLTLTYRCPRERTMGADGSEQR
jgi:hypothetical protein